MLKDEFEKHSPATIGPVIERNNQRYADFLVRTGRATPDAALAQAQGESVLIYVTRPQLETLCGLLAGQGLTEREQLTELLPKHKNTGVGGMTADAVLKAKEPKPGEESMSLVGMNEWNCLVAQGMQGVAETVRPDLEDTLKTYYLEPESDEAYRSTDMSGINHLRF